jgi:hypothetical protein
MNLRVGDSPCPTIHILLNILIGQGRFENRGQFILKPTVELIFF